MPFEKPENTSAFAFLNGGGQCGEMIRKIDWANTPVGPVEHWPLSLRIAIGITLSSQFPMYIAWGKDFTQFYNDGYRPILGTTKHPQAMGISAKITFPEIWDDFLSPLFNGVLEGEGFGQNDLMIPLDRNGYLEECYFYFCYTPVRNENGNVGGIIGPVVETTDRVIVTRRLNLLSNLVKQRFDITRKQICEQTLQTLHTNRHDIPFALFYLWDEQIGGYLLIQTSGLLNDKDPFSLNTASATELITLNDGQPIPVNQISNDALIIKDGVWPEPTVNCSVLPILRYDNKVPLGLIILGISPRLEFNATYHNFFKLIAEHVRTALMTAKTFTEDHKRMEKNARVTKQIEQVFSKAPLPIAILKGPSFVIELANEDILKCIGRAEEQVLNKPLLVALPELAGHGIEELLTTVYQTGEQFVARELAVDLMRNKKVERLFFNFVFEPYYDLENVICGIIMVANEISDQVIARKRIEEVVSERTKELAEMNNNLMQTNVELEQFAYIASHDLQEPLRKITTFTDLLRNSLGPLSESSAGYMDQISSSSNRMKTLIRDVLNFSRVTKEARNFVPVNLNEVLSNIINDFESLIDQKGASIRSDRLPVIEADPSQINQLFYNLMANSLKFSAAEKAPVIVLSATVVSLEEVKAYRSLNPSCTYFQIQFKDNGIGFSQEYAEQIFTIFQRLNNRQMYGGTGIGLALCRKIVANHNGEIFATSIAGKGANFTVIFPKEQPV